MKGQWPCFQTRLRKWLFGEGRPNQLLFVSIVCNPNCETLYQYVGTINFLTVIVSQVRFHYERRVLVTLIRFLMGSGRNDYLQLPVGGPIDSRSTIFARSVMAVLMWALDNRHRVVQQMTKFINLSDKLGSGISVRNPADSLILPANAVIHTDVKNASFISTTHWTQALTNCKWDLWTSVKTQNVILWKPQWFCNIAEQKCFQHTMEIPYPFLCFTNNSVSKSLRKRN